MTLRDPNAAAFELGDPSRAEPPRLAQGGQAAFGVMKRRLASYPSVMEWMERVAALPGHAPVTAG